MEKLIAKAYELLEKKQVCYDDDTYDPWDLDNLELEYLSAHLGMYKICKRISSDEIVKAIFSNPTIENWRRLFKHIKKNYSSIVGVYYNDINDRKQMTIGYVDRCIVINAYDDFETKITQGIDWLVDEIQGSVEYIEENL